MGMGVDTLSMASPGLPRVKRAIRTFPRSQARELLNEALQTTDAAAVHRMLGNAFDKIGLAWLLAPQGSKG